MVRYILPLLLTIVLGQTTYHPHHPHFEVRNTQVANSTNPQTSQGNGLSSQANSNTLSSPRSSQGNGLSSKASSTTSSTPLSTGSAQVQSIASPVRDVIVGTTTSSGVTSNTQTTMTTMFTSALGSTVPTGTTGGPRTTGAPRAIGTTSSTGTTSNAKSTTVTGTSSKTVTTMTTGNTSKTRTTMTTGTISNTRSTLNTKTSTSTGTTSNSRLTGTTKITSNTKTTAFTSTTKTTATTTTTAATFTGQQAPAACAVNTINNNDGIGNGTDHYVTYRGNGTVQQGWPDKSKWASFGNMFNNYRLQMFHSCSIFSQPRDTDAEIAAIFNGIQQVALETKIDHRFILAIMMQESAGCVRVSTTGHTYRNPGLMQDHEGNATCNENGYAPFPCPNGTITQMIRDGASGTDYGNGLAGALIQAVQYGGGAAAITYYRAARLYNSGAIDPSGNLEAGTATHCYASDIANRLAGWTNADRNCTLT